MGKYAAMKRRDVLPRPLMNQFASVDQILILTKSGRVKAFQNRDLRYAPSAIDVAFAFLDLSTNVAIMQFSNANSPLSYPLVSLRW
jgi:hypothetical protein